MISPETQALPGFGPAAEDLLFRQKVPKPMTLCLAASDRADASLERAAQLAEPVLRLLEGLRQGSPDNKSVRPKSRTAGVGEEQE